MRISLSVMSVAATISVFNFLGLIGTTPDMQLAERGSGRIKTEQTAERGSGRVTNDQAYRGSGRFKTDQAYRGSGRFVA